LNCIRRVSPVPRAGVSLLALVVLLGVALPGAGVAEPDTTQTPAARAGSAATATAHTTTSQPLFMWNVRSPTATVHLLGSVHIGTADFYPLDAVIEQAFTSSDALAVELDMTDPETLAQSTRLFLQKATYPANESLADHVTPETYGALERYAAEHGVPLLVLGRMRPGAAAMYLVLDELQRRGYDPELGVDMHFLRRAKPDREVRALETVAQQIDAIFGDDAVVDELLLEDALTRMAGLDSVMTEMVVAWQQGDAAAMAGFIEQELLGDERLRSFHDRILTDRNERMLAVIEEILAGDRTWFVVIGAAHLVGESGLVTSLTAAGYTVTQALSAVQE